MAERSPGFGPGRLELEQLDGLADSTTNLIGKTGIYEMTGTILNTGCPGETHCISSLHPKQTNPRSCEKPQWGN